MKEGIIITKELLMKKDNVVAYTQTSKNVREALYNDLGRNYGRIKRTIIYVL